MVALCSETGKIVGAFTLEDSVIGGLNEEAGAWWMGIIMEEQEKQKTDPNWKNPIHPMYKILSEMDKEFNDEFKIDPEYLYMHQDEVSGKINQFAHLICVAVDPDWCRKGIATKLTELALKSCKNKKFRAAYSECTSIYSSKALQKHGMKVEKTVQYDSYDFCKNFFRSYSLVDNYFVLHSISIVRNFLVPKIFGY